MDVGEMTLDKEKAKVELEIYTTYRANVFSLKSRGTISTDGQNFEDIQQFMICIALFP